MIGIVANDRRLELPEDLNIDFEINNSAFSEGGQNGSFSFSFTAPYTPSNQEFFEHSHLRQVRGTKKDYDVYIKIDRVFWKEALLTVSRDGPKGYEVEIKIDLSVFFTLLNDIKLADLAGSDSYTITETASTFTYRQILIANPVNSIETYFFQRNGLTIANSTYDAQGTETLAEALSRLAANVMATEPADYKVTAIGQTIYVVEYNPSDTFRVGDTQQFYTSTDQVYSQIEPLAEYPDFVFPTVATPNWYGEGQENNPDFAGFVNIYNPNSSRMQINSLSNFPVVNQHSLVPYLKLSWLMDKIEIFTGYTFTGDFVNDNNLIPKLVIYNTYSLDRQDPTFYESVFNSYNELVAYQNHLPDVSVTNFLVNLALNFNLGIDVDDSEKTVELYFRKDLITGSDQDDWTSQARGDASGRAQFSKQRAYPHRHVYGYTKDFQDEGFQRVELGTFVREKEFLSELGSLPALSNGQTSDETEGNSSMFDQGQDNDFAPRLLFYHGIVNNQVFATSEVYANFPYSLRWDGDRGLYRQFHEDWAIFRQAADQEPIEEEFLLTLEDLIALDINRKKIVESVEYLASQVKFQLSNQTQSIRTYAKVMLYKIP